MQVHIIILCEHMNKQHKFNFQSAAVCRRGQETSVQRTERLTAMRVHMHYVFELQIFMVMDEITSRKLPMTEDIPL
jgi:hypothetical protein